MPYIYVGENAGARILRYGVGFTQVGDPYDFDVRTQELRPAGMAGDVQFRTVEVLIRHRLGYNIEVTSYVDGVAGIAQVFNAGAPPLDQLEEFRTLQAYIGRRGTAVAVRVRTLSILGEVEIVDVSSSHAVIRVTP